LVKNPADLARDTQLLGDLAMGNPSDRRCQGTNSLRTLEPLLSFQEWSCVELLNGYDNPNWIGTKRSARRIATSRNRNVARTHAAATGNDSSRIIKIKVAQQVDINLETRKSRNCSWLS